MIEILQKIRKHGLTGSLRIAPGVVRSRLRKCTDAFRLTQARVSCRDFYIVKEVQGSKMLLNLADFGISRELFFTQVHEPESTKQFVKEIKPGMTVIEVGANIGYYALMAARIIGPGGRIIAFEPSPENMRTFRMNVVLNGFEKNVETYPFAVGSKAGKAEFYLMDKGNTSSFYARERDSGLKTTGRIEVDVVTLDGFFKDRSVPIDYLRMDVEGFEYEVTRGMEGLLKTNNAPKGLFVEVHSQLLNENGHSCKGYLDFLAGFGYRVVAARFRGKAEMLVRSSEELTSHPLVESGYWETFFRRDL